MANSTREEAYTSKLMKAASISYNLKQTLNAIHNISPKFQITKQNITSSTHR